MTLRLVTGSDTLSFGKYKGQTALSVMKRNASYLLWANENINWFCLSEEFQEQISEAASLQSESRSIGRAAIRAYGRPGSGHDWGGLTDEDFA